MEKSSQEDFVTPPVEWQRASHTPKLTRSNKGALVRETREREAVPQDDIICEISCPPPPPVLFDSVDGMGVVRLSALQDRHAKRAHACDQTHMAVLQRGDEWNPLLMKDYSFALSDGLFSLLSCFFHLSFSVHVKAIKYRVVHTIFCTH